MKNADVEFLAELRRATCREISKLLEKLIEDDPEKYCTGTTDYGYYNNGIGMACYGKEKTYDDDKAYNDARDAIAEDIANESVQYEYAIKLFIENKELTTALAKWIKTL